MDEPIHTALTLWANFYLVTGSAAAALTGLQFIVQTLIASNAIRPATGTDPEGGIGAFGTPTVVHFSLALLTSALLCAPWTGYAGLRVTLSLLGAGALVYSAIVLRRARRQRSYKPTTYDWFWHVVLPASAYATILSSAMLLDSRAEVSFFAIAGATLLLICVGIHNAWDTVTYLTVAAIRKENSPSESKPAQQHNSGKHRQAQRR